VRSKKVEQICEELARTVGAAPDSCVVAWDDGAAPRILFATGDTEAVFHQKAGDLVGQPAGALFSGGERAAKDLAALCANVPASEQRPMLRAGAPFAAQLLLRGVNGGDNLGGKLSSRLTLEHPVQSLRQRNSKRLALAPMSHAVQV